MTAGDTVQRVAVWSARLRASHWLSAAAVLTLLASGWLMNRVVPAQGALRDLHYIAGYGLLLALLWRGWLLLFGRAAERWSDLWPRGPQRPAAWHTLRFYLSLGRAPVPAWYAHNPLWGPIYLLWWLLLVALLFTGLWPDAASTLGMAAAYWHSLLAHAVAILVAAHVVAVFAHDLKGEGADVSAMINGYRLFRIRRAVPQVKTGRAVSLDALMRSNASGRNKNKPPPDTGP